MANLFERPIAANPMSSFVELPLQFLDHTIQRKQQKYDMNKAMVQAAEDEFLKTKALYGDVPRHREILKGYEDQINQIVDATDGDYSRIGGQLDALKRQMSKDLNYGELGAINNAYAAAMASKADAEKKYGEGKISEAGLSKLNRSIQSYRTSMLDNGSWSSFKGYNPSNVVDPIAEFHQSVKNIHAKYSEDGIESVDDNLVRENLRAKMASNPEIAKAILESYEARGGNTEEGFNDYVTGIMDRVINDQTYTKISDKLIDKKSNLLIPGSILQDWQQPQRISGASERTGGNVSALRAMGKWVGFDTQAEHEKFVKSDEGKRMIERMEVLSGTKMPDNYYDQVDWFDTNENTPMNSTIELGEVNPKLLQFAITDTGFLNTQGATYTQDGKLESEAQRREWQGKTEDGNVARMIGVVRDGGLYPRGSYVFQGRDGKLRIQEPSDPRTIRSQEYNRDILNSVSYTRTGNMPISIKADIVDTRDPTKVAIPQGNYKAVHDIKKGTISLYQDGVLKYVKLPDNSIRKMN